LTEERANVKGDRCIICGYKKWSSKEDMDKPLCLWCGDPLFYAVLDEVIQQLDSEIESSPIIDCNTNPLFSFVADLGMLGTQHNFLASLRDVLGEMVRQVAAEGRAAFDELWSASKLKHIYQFLSLLQDIELVNIDAEAEEVRPKSSIFQKVATITEVDARFKRASTFVLGYVTLKAIEKTLELVQSNGELHYGEGMTKIYPIDRNGRILVLKGYTAPISFIFGTWARGRNEFDDGFLHGFLSNRGIGGREYVKVKNWFTSSRPGSVIGLYTFQTILGVNGFPVYAFKLDPEYQQIRDRILERARERIRQRSEA